ncbi:MAG: hypothetical protein EXS36_02640 [Pedosphaera sp.]|nr:hypothetical protein [Pedosphaera sp.]
MKTPSDRRRRFAANLFLSAALVMVLAGLTFLQSHIRGVGYLLYWTTCYLFTMSALLLAIWDAGVMRARIAREKAELEADIIKTKTHHPG